MSVFLLTLFAGIYDLGQSWRTGLATNEAARTGARVGSARGIERDADFAALSGAKAALESSGKLGLVERVVVFKAAADGKVPAACKLGSNVDCQVITGVAFRTPWEQVADTTLATTASGCLNIASAKNWCPTTRGNIQISSEYYGIWIKLRQPYEFPILGSGTDVERTAVMRLEPKA